VNALPKRIADREWNAFTHARGGAPYLICPVDQGYWTREIEFLNYRSDRTHDFRHAVQCEHLPPHLIDRLAAIDCDLRMTFVAAMRVNGTEQFVGIARCGFADDRGHAKFGVAVSDAWQRQGIGSELLKHLCRYAKRHGSTRMVGTVLTQNVGMLHVARKLGFKSAFAKCGTHEIELDLASIDAQIDGEIYAACT
jgi:RimJ/RimL family protein N-acetyltransferase